MNPLRRHGGRLVAVVIAAAVVLGVVTTVLLTAIGPFRPAPFGARCEAPALPGQVVDVAAMDMGSGMMGRPGPGNAETMRLRARPAAVPEGTVSLRVFDAGTQAHEVVVLPLPAGRAIGQRAIGPDGKVDESGSVGEAASSCAAGEGDGIAPGATGWTTVTLRPGRYELLCNLPWHYASGMYTELDVARS